MPRLSRRTGGEISRVAVLLLMATFIVFIYAAQHEQAGCHPDCYDGAQRTYEPGHAWTAYAGSWQWQAQWTLAFVGVLAAALSMFAETRPRLSFSVPALRSVAVLAAGGWLLWVLLEPPIPH